METNNQNQFENFRKITISESKKTAMRSELLQFMKTPQVIHARPQKVRSPFSQFIFNTQRAFAVLVVLAGILGVVQVSEGAKFGDVLYPVKVYLADPINDLFHKKENEPNVEISSGTKNESQVEEGTIDANVVDPAKAETKINALLTASTEDKSAKNKTIVQNGSESATENATLNTEVTSDSVDTVATSASLPEPSESLSLRTNSNIVLPSLLEISASVVPESGRIKVLYPDRYVVAKTGDRLEIKWENNLLGTEDGKQNSVTISLQSVPQTPIELIKNYEIADNKSSFKEDTYVWIVQDEIPSGYYKIKIVPVGEGAVSGISEEFAIVKE